MSAVKSKSVEVPARQAVTIPQAGEMLSVSARSVWRLIAAGELDAISIGRAKRVTVASIEKFVTKGGA